jgi:ribosomal protein S18 acetylase RimI-like enzyme
MSVELRSLKPTDRPLLEGILRSDETFRDDEVAVALELVDDALASPTSDYWFRVATRAGEAAGYICFGPTPMTSCTYDLYWIVVHAKHRGQGIARALIEEMELALKERGARAQIRVETSQSEGYGAARKLYDALGYPETARFKDFYSDGDDLIVFYKNL